MQTSSISLLADFPVLASIWELVPELGLAVLVLLQEVSGPGRLLQEHWEGHV